MPELSDVNRTVLAAALAPYEPRQQDRSGQQRDEAAASGGLRRRRAASCRGPCQHAEAAAAAGASTGPGRSRGFGGERRPRISMTAIERDADQKTDPAKCSTRKPPEHR